MLTLLDATGRYELPTGWHEVATRQYCDLDRLQLATVEARASYFAGRPIQVNGLVADALAWMLTPPSREGGYVYPVDLGQETFLQVETIRAALAKQPLYECFGEVFGTFVTRHWSLRHPAEFNQVAAAEEARACLASSITDTYPAVAHCLAEVDRLNEAFAALYEPDETEAGRQARAAGADRLAGFGHLNVARLYAREFSTTIDAVYQMPWLTIAMFLLQDRISAEIMDTLRRTNNSSHD